MAPGRKTGGKDFKKGDDRINRKGRPHEDEETKRRKIALRDRLREYLESGEAAEDFERLRTDNVGSAIELALDRVEGKAVQTLEHRLDTTPPINWSQLSVDERKQLRDLYDKARRGAEALPGPQQIPG